MKIRAAVAAVPLLACLLAPASADVAFRDGRNPGPLDIVRVKVKRTKETARVQITLRSEVTRDQLRPPNFLVLDIDYTLDGRSDLLHFVQPYRGHLGVFRYSPRSNHYRSWSTSRFSQIKPRTIQIEVPHSPAIWRSRGGFLLGVGSLDKSGPCPDGCLDVAPNRFWLLYDHSRPSISRVNLPIVAHEGGRPRARLTYSVADRLSGVRDQGIYLWRKGARTWSRIGTRRGSGFKEFEFELAEGRTASVGVRAWDRQGNTFLAPLRQLTAPIDDATAGKSEFSGFWETRGNPDAYMGTEHVSAIPLDEVGVPAPETRFKFSGRGQHFCLLHSVGPEYGIAKMTIEQKTFLVDMGAPSQGSLRRYCVVAGTAGEHEVVVEPQTGKINVDGFWADDIVDPAAHR